MFKQLLKDLEMIETNLKLAKKANNKKAINRLEGLKEIVQLEIDIQIEIEDQLQLEKQIIKLDKLLDKKLINEYDYRALEYIIKNNRSALGFDELESVGSHKALLSIGNWKFETQAGLNQVRPCIDKEYIYRLLN